MATFIAYCNSITVTLANLNNHLDQSQALFLVAAMIIDHSWIPEDRVQIKIKKNASTNMEFIGGNTPKIDVSDGMN